MTPALYTTGLFHCSDAALVGGKAVNLGRLLRGGFTVPDGFVVTTRAYAHAQQKSSAAVPVELTPEVGEEILAAYRAIGAGPVAVRSSATAEDMGSASMAGQYETFLNIVGEENVLDAVRRCWASLDVPRTRAYLQEHGIDVSTVAMAVVIQRMVAADVAGVLFTMNPAGNGHREMLLEASWGLGEMVVSGRVQPDVLRLDLQTGAVIEAKIADKQVFLAPGAQEEKPVEESRRRQGCLSARDVFRLWQVGHRAAEHFGSPQDIEWAICGGELYLTQSRPITTGADAVETEKELHAARQQIQNKLTAGRGPWVVHNLAETLPHPTPLTWSVIKDFMSGSGGFGAMYRQAGFFPSPKIDRDGFLDLICGRIYMDVSLAPEMFFEGFPFQYDINELKKSPDASQLPPTIPIGSLAARIKAGRKLAALSERLTALSIDYDRKLRDSIFLEVDSYVESNKQVETKSLSTDWLITMWEEHEKLVMGTFAAQLLMPSLICGMALGNLKEFLQEHFWDEDAGALAQLLSGGGPLNRTVMADAELYEVGRGLRPLETWLADHGHRASGEFDLAAPRWRERPSDVLEMAARLADSSGPLERHHHHSQEVSRRTTELAAKLSPRDRLEFETRLQLVQRYVPFREDAKDVLMAGYDLLRDLALEAGRRLEIGEDVFYLTREELFHALRVGLAPLHLIQQRKNSHAAAARAKLPHVIDAQAIESLGKLPRASTLQGGHKAFAISAGRATGTAKILMSPTQSQDLGHDYILVCPSTDPSWTPLFVNAAGLVLECGGSLSHGAVVAREMGLPAVVLPDATSLLCEGDLIHVDGDGGWVGPGTTRAAEMTHKTEVDLDSVQIPPTLIPPPSGRKDRTAAKARNACAIIWTIYIVGFFFLPARWIHDPSLRVMDAILWPIVRWSGKPGVVVVVATGLAALTLLIQKYMADNERLIEAKRRAALLKEQARLLPADSRRRAAMLQLAMPVQFRSLSASLVPIGVLLGPMMLPLVWFQSRIDPAAWNAPVGSSVQIVASIASDFTQPVRIEVPPEINLDEMTPTARTLPPLRKPLERLLTLYQQPRNASGDAWELRAAPDDSRKAMADDLRSYLDAGIPPQGMTWLIHPQRELSEKFPVKILAQGYPPVSVEVVLGDHFAPVAAMTSGPAPSPVREVRVVYPRAQQERVFWRPLHALQGLPAAAGFASVDVGWLGLYIFVYLPVLLLLRALLRVA